MLVNAAGKLCVCLQCDVFILVDSDNPPYSRFSQEACFACGFAAAGRLAFLSSRQDVG